LTRRQERGSNAGVVGGFKDYAACEDAVPRASAAASLTATDDDPDGVQIFLCPQIDIEGIKKEQEHAEKAPDDPRPPLDMTTQQHTSDL